MKRTCLDHYLIARICSAVAAGRSDQEAAAHAGVDERRLHEWEVKGLDVREKLESNPWYPTDWHEQLCVELAERLAVSRIVPKIRFLRRLRKASRTNWRATAQLLELLYPEEFAKPKGPTTRGRGVERPRRSPNSKPSKPAASALGLSVPRTRGLPRVDDLAILSADDVIGDDPRFDRECPPAIGDRLAAISAVEVPSPARAAVPMRSQKKRASWPRR
jgi:hypothetical protein